MLSQVSLLAVLPFLVQTSANPLYKRWTAEPFVGSTTADMFPPPSGE